MIKIIYKFSIVFLLFLVSSSLVFTAYFSVELKKPGPLYEDKTILIKPGFSSKKIANILFREEVISNKYFFLIYSKILSRSKTIKAGEYKFAKGLSLIKVIKLLENGETLTRTITIPEGLTSYEIIQILHDEPKLSGTIDIIPEEGSLFPSTYHFKYGDLRSSILRQMQNKMIKYSNEQFSIMKPNNYIKNTNDLITLASIIEKEAGNSREKPIIASVFYNRFKKKMKLQSDPTVIYGITNGRGRLGRSISKQDLLDKNDYNTYYIDGLPPRPIANPGLESLKAASNPASTCYLYFVVDGTGGHNFSEDYAKHNEYVKQYRERNSDK